MTVNVYLLHTRTDVPSDSVTQMQDLDLIDVEGVAAEAQPASRVQMITGETIAKNLVMFVVSWGWVVLARRS